MNNVMNIMIEMIETMTKDSELYIGVFVPWTEDCELHVRIKCDVFGKKMLVAGSATNNTIFSTYKMQYDDIFSLDENLQQFFDDINEKIVLE